VTRLACCLILLVALRTTALGKDAPNPERSQTLAQAIVQNDVGLVRQLVDAGVDVNGRPFGATPLHLSAEYGRSEIAQLLLNRGAEVDSIDNLGRTPLLWAAVNRHSDVAQLLLSHGADVNRDDPLRFRGPMEDDAAETPLDYAIRGGDLGLCRIFFAAGAKIQKKNLGRLRRAIYSKNPDVLAWLIEKGAEPTMTSENGDSALAAAGTAGNLEMVKILLAKSRNASALKPLLNDALQHAAEYGRTAFVHFLLDHTRVELNRQVESSYGGVTRGDPDKKVKTPGFTALSRGVEHGYDEIVEALLKKGAHVSGRTRSGAPVLTFAISQDRDDLFQLLMKYKPALNDPDIDGRTALMAAAIKNKVDTVRTLAQHGANLDQRNLWGATAMMMGCEAGATPAVDDLLGSGAKTDAHDDEGRDALMYAATGGHSGMCALLIGKGADVNYVQPKTGMTALHWAAKTARPFAIKELLAAGASSQVLDKEDKRPLDLAQLSGDPESIALLKAKPSP
jgi:ankyrin repeat protein